VASADRVCAECGLRTAPGENDCAGLRDLLFARDFEQPALHGRHHRLAVDSYCVQHEPYVRSTKSLAAHLCGLCVAIEHGNDQALLGGINGWLSTNPQLVKPDLPASRGDLTIAHVSGIDDPLAYGRAVDEWARSAWEAYRDLHELARRWLSLSMHRRR
jgi:Family of unknown function (DUF5946)